MAYTKDQIVSGNRSIKQKGILFFTFIKYYICNAVGLSITIVTIFCMCLKSFWSRSVPQLKSALVYILIQSSVIIPVTLIAGMSGYQYGIYTHQYYSIKSTFSVSRNECIQCSDSLRDAFVRESMTLQMYRTPSQKLTKYAIDARISRMQIRKLEAENEAKKRERERAKADFEKHGDLADVKH